MANAIFSVPTVILAKDPHFVTMEEEIFAPVPPVDFSYPFMK